ncbi:hypothetical protein [uncultured Limosilactobacillus sp.]|uniref:hypothetical protein n=1 Tax=uncultured Limosilactobacillus sp. TaxID=2837629 RepID=UPI00272CB265|nr:hypothetical protein [uncultured Limosilactobacillus sp.]
MGNVAEIRRTIAQLTCNRYNRKSLAGAKKNRVADTFCQDRFFFSFYEYMIAFSYVGKKLCEIFAGIKVIITADFAR